MPARCDQQAPSSQPPVLAVWSPAPALRRSLAVSLDGPLRRSGTSSRAGCGPCGFAGVRTPKCLLVGNSAALLGRSRAPRWQAVPEPLPPAARGAWAPHAAHRDPRRIGAGHTGEGPLGSFSPRQCRRQRPNGHVPSRAHALLPAQQTAAAAAHVRRSAGEPRNRRAQPSNLRQIPRPLLARPSGAPRGGRRSSRACSSRSGRPAPGRWLGAISALGGVTEVGRAARAQAPPRSVPCDVGPIVRHPPPPSRLAHQVGRWASAFRPRLAPAFSAADPLWTG